MLLPRSPASVWFEGPPGLELDVICDHSATGDHLGLGGRRLEEIFGTFKTAASRSAMLFVI